MPCVLERQNGHHIMQLCLAQIEPSQELKVDTIFQHFPDCCGYFLLPNVSSYFSFASEISTLFRQAGDLASQQILSIDPIKRNEFQT